MQTIEDCKAQIDNDVKNNPVMLYMKGNKDFPQCGFSGQVVQILNDIGAQYETRDVLSDPVLREAIKAYSEWPTLPQLYVNGDFVGGCDIVTELYQSGELKQLIENS